MNDRDQKKSTVEVIQRISDSGNGTKHSKISANYDREQLASDFEAIKQMLIALAKEAKGALIAD